MAERMYAPFTKVNGRWERMKARNGEPKVARPLAIARTKYQDLLINGSLCGESVQLRPVKELNEAERYLQFEDRMMKEFG